MQRSRLPRSAQPFATTPVISGGKVSSFTSKPTVLQAGTWAKIIVKHGLVRVVNCAQRAELAELLPGETWIIPPEVATCMRATGNARFAMTFFRNPQPNNYHNGKLDHAPS